VLAFGVLLACCPCAFALDPALDVSQYAHTAWRSSEGFANGPIGLIVQTPDGYLWLGTEFGLLRFDGIKAVPWQPPPGQHLPDKYIRSLLVTRDGTLWIGTLKGLASWKDGRLTEHSELAGPYVDAIVEDRDGTVWASGTLPGKLCSFQEGKGKAQCYGDDGLFGNAVESILEDSAGNLWVGASTGLWRWKPGAPKRYLPDPITGPHELADGDNGAILFTNGSTIRQLFGQKVEPIALPGIASHFRFPRLFRERNGSLWIGTSDRGLVHVHQGEADFFSQSEGLSGNLVGGFFEDREGNIWVTTDGGLDRFRNEAVSTFATKQNLPGSGSLAVLAARDGTMWISTTDSLNHWINGRFDIPLLGGKRDGKLDGANPGALFQDRRGRVWVSTRNGVGYLENGRFNVIAGIPGGIIRAMAEDTAGNLWVTNQESGLLRLSSEGKVERISWSALGHTDFATALEADPARGGLWAGFYQGGVVYLVDGRVQQSYTTADGLGDGYVSDLRVDRQGTVWAATITGLTRLKDGHLSTLNSRNGLPCDGVHWSIEDDARSLWLYTACGLIRVPRPELDAWVAGMDRGEVEKQSDAMQALHATVLDSSDGARMLGFPSGFSPKVAKSPDGKLWYETTDGVSVVDPSHLPFNKLPPPVHIEQITADRKTYDVADASGGVRLPPLVRDLEIDYTALSLVAPEKNRFRVKLEGWDRDWQDVGNRRQEFYSNLSPGNYRFRVTASNNSGVWNEAGTFLDFSIAPAYYQTNWFRVSCVIAIMLMLWGLYRLRLRQLAREFNTGLEARVSERTRIARDLHDTLLQSFHGLLLRFQTVSNQLPAGDAKQKLESAIDQAAQAITEGRDAVQGLRSSTVEANDLALAIKAIGEELAADATNGNCVEFRVQVEGTPRTLHPILRDEAYRIAGEGLRNAFKHAEAHQIEVEIRYDERQLRLRVRDDGKGIDQKILGGDGRAGHFGLHGIHERAELMGGKVTVWSERDSGTEVELTIPASRAYTTPSAARRSWLTEKLSGRFSSKDKAMKP
jgi:signal transduction histidine kinase/ligand-binding sensor domain-containing protein